MEWSCLINLKLEWMNFNRLWRVGTEMQLQLSRKSCLIMLAGEFCTWIILPRIELLDFFKMGKVLEDPTFLLLHFNDICFSLLVPYHILFCCCCNKTIAWLHLMVWHGCHFRCTEWWNCDEVINDKIFVKFYVAGVIVVHQIMLNLMSNYRNGEV